MKVTIITPTFNSEATLSATVESVKRQTYTEIEYIVVDGQSGDSTLDIIKTLKEDVLIISEPDDGIYDAMNKGVRLAGGEIIGILNSDDSFASDDVLKAVVEEFKRTGADVVFGDIQITGRDGKVIRTWRPGEFRKRSFFWGWHPPHPAFFVKKEIYERCGLFNNDLSFAADFEFMMRVLEKYDTKTVYLPKTIVNMGFGGSTTGSLKNILRGHLQCLKAFKLNGFRIPVLYPFIRLLPKLRQFSAGKSA